MTCPRSTANKCLSKVPFHICLSSGPQPFTTAVQGYSREEEIFMLPKPIYYFLSFVIFIENVPVEGLSHI